MADPARPLLDGEDSAQAPTDDIDTRCRQFVNRWVFLKHQRPVALMELRELIAEAKK